MNKTLLFEQSIINADLSFDIIRESKEFTSLDEGFQKYFEGCHKSGAEYGANLHNDIDEGFFDRVKAGFARTGQAVKNVTGLGTQTSDSKDAGVANRFKAFQQKFEPLINRPPVSPQQANEPNVVVKKADDALNRIDAESQKDPSPAPTPQQAEELVKKTSAPQGLKDKILNAIRQNPGKTKFLLGALSFGAGVAAAAATGGNPLVGKAVGGLINGLGNAALAKIQGRTTGDAFMSGVGGAIAGASLASAGANLTNLVGVAAEKGVEAVHGALGGGVQAQFPAHHAATAANATGGGAYPFAGTDPNQLYQDTGTNVAKGGGAYPFADTDPNQMYGNTGGVEDNSDMIAQQQAAQGFTSNDAALTAQQQAAQGFNQPVDTTAASDAAAPAPAAAPAAAAPASRLKTALSPRDARVAFDKARGTVREDDEESMFEKQDGNIFKLKKTNKPKELNEARQLEPDQLAALNDFLDDLGKMFNVQGAGTDAGRKAVIGFMQGQGTRFKDILDYLNKYQLVDAGQAQPQQQQQGALNPTLVNDINIKIKTLLSGLTILNPKIQKLLPKVPQTRTAGKTSSYVFRLTNSGDIVFIIKGWIGQTPFLYQEKPTIAQQNAKRVLMTEIAYKPIDALKKNFVFVLSQTLAKDYVKMPQMAGQMDQQQLQTAINSYLLKYSQSDAGFKKMFSSILVLLDSVVARMKVSKNKPKQIWIGINAKGTGFFTGVKPAQQKPAGKPAAGKPVSGKPVAGKSPTGKPVKSTKPVGGKIPAAKPIKGKLK